MTMSQHRVGHTQAASPFCNAEGFAVVGDPAFVGSPGWSREGLFGVPAEVNEPIEDGGFGQPCRGRPVFRAQCAAVEGKPHVSSHVAALLGGRGPATVAGLVVPVDVDPVQGASVRPLTHVGEESVKSLPTVAGRDAAPAVVGKGRMLRILAPVLHLLPGLICRRFPAVPRSVPVPTLPAVSASRDARFSQPSLKHDPAYTGPLCKRTRRMAFGVKRQEFGYIVRGGGASRISHGLPYHMKATIV